MQQLGINTIRVYNLDAGLDHNECVSIFNAAGIYMILDVNSGLEGQYLDRSDPSSTYTLEYMQHIFGIVEAFSTFPNVLGFFSGNEIINQDSATEAPAYIRAVTRDLKQYISLHSNRAVPVGYSAADVDTLLHDSWNYLGCELANSTYSKIDFFGLNDYEWCGNSSYTVSGYNVLVDLFAETSIPVFFSEYGCNLVEPRTFTNVPVLYGDEMSILSGGLVYEFTEEADNYGLVDINSTSELTILQDYVYLQEELAKIDIGSLTSMNSSAEAQTATSCATSLITASSFLDSWSLPARPSGGDALVTSGLSSSNPGSIVSVTATTMSPTVIGTAGATETGLKLVILDNDQSNYPGLAKTYSAASGTSTGTGSGTGTSTATGTKASSTKKSAASAIMVFQCGAITVGAFLLLLVL